MSETINFLIAKMTLCIRLQTDHIIVHSKCFRNLLDHFGKDGKQGEDSQGTVFGMPKQQEHHCFGWKRVGAGWGSKWLRIFDRGLVQKGLSISQFFA